MWGRILYENFFRRIYDAKKGKGCITTWIRVLIFESTRLEKLLKVIVLQPQKRRSQTFLREWNTSVWCSLVSRVFGTTFAAFFGKIGWFSGWGMTPNIIIPPFVQTIRKQGWEMRKVCCCWKWFVQIMMKSVNLTDSNECHINWRQ